MITSIKTANRTYITVKQPDEGISYLLTPAGWLRLFDWEIRTIRRLYER